MLDKDKLLEALAHFTGTERYYQASPMSKIVATDGVVFLMKEAECFWLINDIIAWQFEHKCQQCPFQVWELRAEMKDGSRVAILTMKEDSDQPNIVEQEYDYTTFPLDSIQFYLIDGVLLLTSEY